MQMWSDFVVLVTGRHVKLQFLEKSQKNVFSCVLDKVLSNWVFWAIFTYQFLIELGIRIFLLGIRVLMGARITDNWVFTP